MNSNSFIETIQINLNGTVAVFVIDSIVTEAPAPLLLAVIRWHFYRKMHWKQNNNVF